MNSFEDITRLVLNGKFVYPNWKCLLYNCILDQFNISTDVKGRKGSKVQVTFVTKRSMLVFVEGYNPEYDYTLTVKSKKNFNTVIITK